MPEATLTRPDSPIGPAPLVPSPKRPRWLLHLVLFTATGYTITLAGALREWVHLGQAEESLRVSLLFDPGFLAAGLPYSLCLLAILTAHEMGHYVACRHYGVDASLPFFIPSLPVPIGTFGAFIRIRAPIPSRKALFDIGVAGPLAGFVVALPIIVYGFLTAPAGSPPVGAPVEQLPLLMRWLSAGLLGDVPGGYDAMRSGPLRAGWVGCLATALNLLPIGQLDGGHLCYALSARFHRLASRVSLVAFVTLGLLVFPGWLFFATLLIMLGAKHPPVLDEWEGLDRARLATAAGALVILLLCFIPRPFSF
ncbi:MAG TPA: site-2 protease family protein [Candidatus Polarisedimenticolia bacterium]|nr:site-2 protease family protein [Candidatus Polarisedimenticolia bacterium]